MKALVIGFGSIGTRHTHILKGMGVDTAVVSRRNIDAAKKYSTIDHALSDWQPDYVVLASRTQEHLEDFKALVDTGFNKTVIVEKPLFNQVYKTPPHSFERIYVAYNLRFHPVIRRLKELLDETSPYTVHAYVGQYLPQWRPDRDYRDGYSAKMAEGGGVLRDLSHELDFLNWILGGWTRLAAMGGHISNLDIDSDDVCSVLLETQRCPVVSVHLNYLDRAVKREIVAQTKHGTIRADLIACTIDCNGERETFTCERDETYIAQHKAALKGDDDVLCSLDQGMAVLHLIDAVESAVADKKWIAA
jgi:predicted dehydrogenase